MTERNGILIQNIYHMLTYAFQTLRQSNYEKIALEEFDTLQDLFASIIAKGLTQQLKHGLYRNYTPRNECISGLRGKLNMQMTINEISQQKRVLVCEYEDFSENNIFNQIIKLTALLLLQQKTVMTENKKALKKALLFFSEVDDIPPTIVQWNTIHFRKDNQNYRMLLNICRLVMEGLLLSTQRGDFIMATFLDDQQMSRLYEKFILEYYKYHHPELNISAAQIPWTLDDDRNDFLPVMQTDITISHGGKTLIIDAKCYGKSMQRHGQYGSLKVHSQNLYQIFTYVKNKDIESTGNVTGLLLYAKTEEQVTPDFDYQMSGNKISVKTLDLNTNWERIQEQLESFVLLFK